jgi:hypothetical protein
MSIPAWRDTLYGGTLLHPDLRYQPSTAAQSRAKHVQFYTSHSLYMLASDQVERDIGYALRHPVAGVYRPSASTPCLLLIVYL